LQGADAIWRAYCTLQELRARYCIMNLSAFLNRGARYAPTDAERANARVTKAAEESREKWLDAIMVDQLRAWDTVGTHEPGVLEGIATMLTLAGFVHVYDAKTDDTPDIRVIRGAISAATQCVKAGGVVSVDDARAFSSACTRATDIIKAATVPAIIHAATSIRATVGLN